MEKGYVQVYTGNGKGKTTAMLGLALRAYGAGLKIYIGQFIKNMEYNEVKFINKYLPNIDFEQYGAGCIFARDITYNDINSAKNGLSRVREAVFSEKYDIVMLDEINIAIHYGLVSVEDILDLINRKPPHVELVLTGRNAAKEVIAAADLVSEVSAVKHYYEQGVLAREGVEK